MKRAVLLFVQHWWVMQQLWWRSLSLFFCLFYFCDWMAISSFGLKASSDQKLTILGELESHLFFSPSSSKPLLVVLCLQIFANIWPILLFMNQKAVFVFFLLQTTREEYENHEYCVRRRYNDFIWLRQRLEDGYPTHLIPVSDPRFFFRSYALWFSSVHNCFP